MFWVQFFFVLFVFRQVFLFLAQAFFSVFLRLQVLFTCFCVVLCFFVFCLFFFGLFAPLPCRPFGCCVVECWCDPALRADLVMLV